MSLFESSLSTNLSFSISLFEVPISTNLTFSIDFLCPLSPYHFLSCHSPRHLLSLRPIATIPAPVKEAHYFLYITPSFFPGFHFTFIPFALRGPLNSVWSFLRWGLCIIIVQLA